jgi:hypothetical protein
MAEAKDNKKKDNSQQVFELSNRVARSVIAVVDTVVQRGGFRGEELTTIGQLRDQAVQLVQLCEANRAETATD